MLHCNAARTVAESQRWASGGWCRLQAETDGNGLSWWICAPVNPFPYQDSIKQEANR